MKLDFSKGLWEGVGLKRKDAIWEETWAEKERWEMGDGRGLGLKRKDVRW